jgi:carboxymethylenebutenolidase
VVAAFESEATIPGGHDFPPTPVFAALPPGARRGMVVIHEIFGRQPEIDDVVRRFAANGYAAVEPNLWKAPSAFGCIRNTMLAMRTGDGPAVHQAHAIRQWLCDRTAIPQANVGIIGFCFGGAFALAAGRGWGAVSTNYGQIPKSRDVMRGIGPTIGCYGGRDVMNKGAAAKLEAQLRPLGVEVETHTYPDVGHSFLTDGKRPLMQMLSAPILHVDYKPATAEDGWRRIMAFFDKHLGEKRQPDSQPEAPHSEPNTNR